MTTGNPVKTVFFPTLLKLSESANFNKILIKLKPLKVPMSPFFLFSHSKVHIKIRASAKKIFDLNKTQIFYDYLKTLKLTAILAHHSY